MKLFAKRRANRELDTILHELKQYLSNNYKEPAHRAKDQLIRRTEELYAEGLLTEEKYQYWRSVGESYLLKMKDYRH